MINIKYKIVGTFPAEHQVMVRFYSDTLPESELVSAWMPDGVTPARYRTDYLITLPVPTPVGAALEAFIMRHCPVTWFDLKAKIADAAVDTSMSALVASVGVERAVAVDTSPQAPSAPAVPESVAMWQAREILIEEGLLAQINAYFASIPDALMREKTQAKFEYTTIVRRDDPLVVNVIPRLGKSEAQIDAMFVRAAAL